MADDTFKNVITIEFGTHGFTLTADGPRHRYSIYWKGTLLWQSWTRPNRVDVVKGTLLTCNADGAEIETSYYRVFIILTSHVNRDFDEIVWTDEDGLAQEIGPLPPDRLTGRICVPMSPVLYTENSCKFSDPMEPAAALEAAIEYRKALDAFITARSSGDDAADVATRT